MNDCKHFKSLALIPKTTNEYVCSSCGWKFKLVHISNSINPLKVGIPDGISDYLALTTKDKLEWIMQIQNGKRVVIVRKAKNTLRSKIEENKELI